MRLIDADALKKHFTENPSDIDICHIKDLIVLITNAPAITQGEPVAYMSKTAGNACIVSPKKLLTGFYDLDDYSIPLYTAPPQPQTVKDALEKALKCTNSVGSDGRSEYDCIDEGIDFGSFEKGFSEAVDIISNRIRALIEKD